MHDCCCWGVHGEDGDGGHLPLHCGHCLCQPGLGGAGHVSVGLGDLQAWEERRTDKGRVYYLIKNYLHLKELKILSNGTDGFLILIWIRAC